MTEGGRRREVKIVGEEWMKRKEGRGGEER